MAGATARAFAHLRHHAADAPNDPELVVKDPDYPELSSPRSCPAGEQLRADQFQ